MDTAPEMLLPAHQIRLSQLREAISSLGLDGFIVPRADEFQGEYVPACAERLAWLTNFSGSAGMAVVLSDTAAVFSDGRYITQMDQQVDHSSWVRLHITQNPPPQWLAKNAKSDARIGYDPKVVSVSLLASFVATGLTLVAVDENLVDKIWDDRPAWPFGPVAIQPSEYAGQSSQEKRTHIAKILNDASDKAAVICDSASVAWLLNIRGNDVPYTPFVLAFAIIDNTGAVQLFIDDARLDDATREHLGGITIRPPSALAGALKEFASKRVRIDPATTSAWFVQMLKSGGATVIESSDPCSLPKAIKNDTEQSGARRAHTVDAVAICRFLHWLDANGVGKTETEISTKLSYFRAQSPEYREDSFAAISGAGPNGAIMHYRAQPGEDRTLEENEVFLIDSGGQYPFGTTDITRTIWTGPGAAPDHVRNAFTRVLKGNIALSMARFPAGTTGHRLDSLARSSLWEAGLDYDHGTGHGVGSYLSVHEGPCNISPVPRPVPLEPGMVISNEPGYYEPGAFGIRLENLLLVKTTDNGIGNRAFHAFEVLTYAPFDQRLIDVTLLNQTEVSWLNSYHAKVAELVRPLIEDDAFQWVSKQCEPISAG